MYSEAIEINREELAWAAGFFDGEGYIGRAGVGTVRITVAQKEITTLERFQKAVLGIGKIYGPDYNGINAASPIWKFWCTNFQDTQAVVGMLWYFLSEPKRKQAREALLNVRWSARYFNPGPIKTREDSCRHGHSLKDAYSYERFETGKEYLQCRPCTVERSRERYLNRKSSVI